MNILAQIDTKNMDFRLVSSEAKEEIPEEFDLYWTAKNADYYTIFCLLTNNTWIVKTFWYERGEALAGQMLFDSKAFSVSDLIYKINNHAIPIIQKHYSNN